MKLLLVVRQPSSWERAVQQALKAVKERETYLLFMDEAVKRCIRCEPELFKHLHQFVLDGGHVLLCLRSLSSFGLPPKRPPDFFQRIESGEAFISQFDGEVQEISS